MTDERRQRTTELAESGLSLKAIAEQLAAEGYRNPKTGRAYSVTTVFNDLSDSGQTAQPVVEVVEKRPEQALAPVEEMIGRVATTIPWWNRSALTTLDKTQPDYATWDKLRGGKLAGFEMAGTLCAPIVQTLAAFQLGSGLTITLAEGGDPNNEKDNRTYTDRKLADFTRRVHPQLLKMEEDKLALGDQYVVVNPDGTLSIPSPETVSLETDITDYREVVSYKIYNRLDKAVVEDIYRKGQREVRITYSGNRPQETRVERFSVLIDELPVIHFPNDRGGNELYGRPVYEALLRAFSRYDDIIEKGLDGLELMGNPIPVIEGLESVDTALANNDTLRDETYYDADNYRDTRKVVKFDRLPMMLLGKGANFKFAAPDKGFGEDIRKGLEEIFTLISNHTRIPEFLWGMSVAQSKASTETQLPPFIQYITSRRIKLQPYIESLVRVWLKMMALTDPRIVVDDVRIVWPEITLDDSNITLQKVIYAAGNNIITPITALEKLRIVPDAAKEVQMAQEQQRELLAKEQDDFMTRLNATAREEVEPKAPENERPRITDLVPPDPDGGRNVSGGDRPVGEMGGLGMADTGYPVGISPGLLAATRKPRRKASKVFAEKFGEAKELPDIARLAAAAHNTTPEKMLRVLRKVHRRGVQEQKSGMGRAYAFALKGKPYREWDADLIADLYKEAHSG